MSKIFISHSSQDNAKALAVGDWLKGNGWDEYFLDITPAQGLSPGERWQEALKKAADRCEVVLFLISPAWRDSQWCLAEFLLAKQLGKRIFGLLIEPTPLDSLPKEMTSEWQLANLIDGNKRIAITVQHDPLVAKTTISFAEAGLALLKQGLQKAGLDPTHFDWPPAHDPQRAPYRGLKALEAEDAAIFFGRDAAIVRGLDKLRLMRDEGVERLFVVLSASGAGKSSYLRAGLWPRLTRDDRHFFPLPVIRPENHVITGPTGLIAAVETVFERLGQKKNRGDLRQAIDNPTGFAQLLIELQALAHARLVTEAEPPTIILSIDQGEELFGSDGREEAERFLTLLGPTLSPPSGDPKSAQAARRRIIGIIAMRSDSYDRLQTAPTLAAVKHNPFNLKPIAREDFKTIIEGPANVITDRGQKLAIDPNLTEQLLVDTTGADALPLLAFTLERLYLNYGKDGDLLLDEYEKLGGVRGSIEAAVATALANPDQPPAIPRDPATLDEHLRQTFIPWLAGIDPETGLSKRRVSCREELPNEAQPFIDRLVQARLLTQDQRTIDTRQGLTTIIEVAHEALLRQWPTLTKWLEQDAEQLKTTETVRRGAAEWEKKGRGDEWLDLRGERLKAAEALRQRPDLWSLLSQQGQDYIAKCREKEDRARAEREEQQIRTSKMQERIGRLLAVVSVVLIAGVFGVLLQTRAVGEKTSLVLATAAQTASDVGHLERALRLATLAAEDTWLSPTSVEAEPQLARAAHSSAMLVSLQHEDTVRSATFSPDSTRVVTASFDRSARVWDITTGKELARFIHEDRVWSATFSPDGTRVVTASLDKTVRICDIATGMELTRFVHEDRVASATFSPDGAKVVTASADNTAKVWDVVTGKELMRFTDEDRVRSATFSPDSTRVVTVSDDNTAKIWDVVTGKELARFTHKDRVESATFNPSSTRVVTASRDYTAKIWDVTTGKELVRFTHGSHVSAATFSPDGTRIITASDDNTAKIWDVVTGKELMRFTHEDSVRSATLSPDGTRVVTASRDNTAKVWDVITGKELTRFTHEGSVVSATFSPDGTRIVTASDDNTAKVWDVATGKELARFIHGSHVSAATFSPDGTRIVSASLDQTARVWDITTGKELARFIHEDRVWSATFSPDSTRIVTASLDRTARVWGIATGKELTRFTHEDRVRSATFSPDGTRVVTVSDHRSAQVWDIATGKELARFTHEGFVGSASLSPDGTRVVTASYDNTARVWHIATGKELTRFTHKDRVTSATFSPDGTRVVTASYDNTARVWHIATGEELTRFIHGDRVASATFSPDGARIVTVSTDRSARVWDVVTEKELAQLTHENRVASATFSPDGTRVITASVDRTARVWDVVTEKELARFTHEDTVWSATFSPDGTKVVTASLDRSTRVWDIHWLTQYYGQELIERVCREKLIGARHITKRDIEISPILSGREGEDVCDPPSWFSHLMKNVGLGP